MIRRKRNTILNIKNPNGNFLSNKYDIGSCFVNYFNEVFKSYLDVSSHLDNDLSQLFF